MKEEILHIIESAYQDGYHLAHGHKDYKPRKEELADATIEVFKKEGYKLFLMNQATIMGRSMDEVCAILNMLDIEREADMKLTYSNLQKYMELLRKDVHKATERALKAAVKSATQPKYIL